jgi:hypothetical protein
MLPRQRLRGRLGMEMARVIAPALAAIWLAFCFYGFALCISRFW